MRVAATSWRSEHGKSSSLPELDEDVRPALAFLLAGGALGLATVGLWALRFLQVL
jgi:hypothetical protein